MAYGSPQTFSEACASWDSLATTDLRAGPDDFSANAVFFASIVRESIFSGYSVAEAKLSFSYSNKRFNVTILPNLFRQRRLLKLRLE